MYKLKIIPVLISVDFFNSKKYILSTDTKKLIFPEIQCENITNIKQCVIDSICDYFVDTLTIRPYVNNIKFIDINNNYIMNIYNNITDTIFLTYGVTLPKIDIKQNYWTSFDFKDIDYPNELAIIGKTIQYNV